jgi:hypothetical protein
MDEPLALRFPSSGAERLEGRLRQQHEQVRNQQHRHGCQDCQKLSVAHFIRIKPRRNKMRVNRPSRASAALWFLRRTAGGARPWEGSARSRRRCRRWTTACPRNGTHDWTQPREHSPFLWQSARSMKAWPCRDTEAANTLIWQLVILPAEPVYWRATPARGLALF